MISYIETRNEEMCCGCRACEQVCPTSALKLQINEEGFLYPVLAKNLCINCKLCDKVCPVMNRPEGGKVLSIYAVQHKNRNILCSSSSGGVFRLIADYVIDKGGYVVGCKFDEKNKAVLELTNKKQDLTAMQGSKYVSSDSRDIYTKVKKLLDQGKLVLFTGAPCQCAGLKNFLQKIYDNLITADFVCHGMPSQSMLDTYISALSKRAKNISEIKFRDKEKKGWGLAFSYKYGNKKKTHIGLTDPYIFGFTRGFFNRFSCYSCNFRGEDRFTDFTFCDFWGINKFIPELDSKKGVSAVSINSERAESVRRDILHKALWITARAEDVAIENPSLLYKDKEPIPAIRNKIYFMVNKKGWKYVERKYLKDKNLILKKLWYALPDSISNKVKKIIRGE